MTTVHFRKPVLFFGAISASFATLAVETSAQPRSAPERPLSDAVSEALRSPFHADHAAPGPRGQRLLLPVAGSLLALPTHIGLAALPASLAPSGQVRAPDRPPSDNKVFLLSILGAAAGYFGTLQLVEVCEPEPGRYDFGGYQDREKRQAICVLDGDTILQWGFLATVPMTAGAAMLAGSGFRRSLLGSALGFAGGVLLAGYLMAPDDMSDGAVAGVLSLAHATITTVIAN